jgi:hypothetical protein
MRWVYCGLALAMLGIVMPVKADTLKLSNCSTQTERVQVFNATDGVVCSQDTMSG